VTPLSLRIGVAGGLAEPVIDRNTPVPIEQTRAFTTVQDNQERVKIRVYQGESRKADENELLGQFELASKRRAAGADRRHLRDQRRRHRERHRRDRTGQQASTEILLPGLSKEEMGRS
jgi:molecular chaperone DnaK (HSP70)